MARLRHALFADFVSPGDKGKPTIVGLFENLYLTAEQLKTASVGPFYLFVQIDCQLAEGSHHRVEIRFVDADGQQLGAPHAFEDVGFTQQAPGLPLSAKFIIALTMVFPAHGDYTLDIRVDGKPLDYCPMITVAAPPPRREP